MHRASAEAYGLHPDGIRIETVEQLVERVYASIRLEPSRIEAIRGFVKAALTEQQATLEVERRTQARRVQQVLGDHRAGQAASGLLCGRHHAGPAELRADPHHPGT